MADFRHHVPVAAAAAAAAPANVSPTPAGPPSDVPEPATPVRAAAALLSSAPAALLSSVPTGVAAALRGPPLPPDGLPPPPRSSSSIPSSPFTLITTAAAATTATFGGAPRFGYNNRPSPIPSTYSSSPPAADMATTALPPFPPPDVGDWWTTTTTVRRVLFPSSEPPPAMAASISAPPAAVAAAAAAPPPPPSFDHHHRLPIDYVLFASDMVDPIRKQALFEMAVKLTDAAMPGLPAGSEFLLRTVCQHFIIASMTLFGGVGDRNPIRIQLNHDETITLEEEHVLLPSTPGGYDSSSGGGFTFFNTVTNKSVNIPSEYWNLVEKFPFDPVMISQSKRFVDDLVRWRTELAAFPIVVVRRGADDAPSSTVTDATIPLGASLLATAQLAHAMLIHVGSDGIDRIVHTAKDTLIGNWPWKTQTTNSLAPRLACCVHDIWSSNNQEQQANVVKFSLSVVVRARGDVVFASPPAVIWRGGAAVAAAASHRPPLSVPSGASRRVTATVAAAIAASRPEGRAAMSVSVGSGSPLTAATRSATPATTRSAAGSVMSSSGRGSGGRGAIPPATVAVRGSPVVVMAAPVSTVVVAAAAAAAEAPEAGDDGGSGGEGGGHDYSSCTENSGH